MKRKREVQIVTDAIYNAGIEVTDSLTAAVKEGLKQIRTEQFEERHPPEKKPAEVPPPIKEVNSLKALHQCGKQGPSGCVIEASELEHVRNAIQIVLRGMQGGETKNANGLYCRMVDYGVLEIAYETLCRYELLLANEPFIQKIADVWRESGKFIKSFDGVI